ncbi:MAG: ABC transporter substrate-binding protein [Chloroflexi bacterium]|nr:MAG: ABC transporter substrate-binding protein [Chloroflexota bacterium]
MKGERSRLEDVAAWEAFRASVTRRDVLKYGVGAALSFSVVDSLLAACSPAHGTSTTSTSKTPTDTLVVAVEGDIDTFDPAFTVGSKPAQTTIQNTFDQLTQYKHADKTVAGVNFTGVDTEQIDGMLAESYQTSGNQVIFTLRQGLTYNDGTPITAPVIEQGYRRIFEAQGISYFLLSMAAVPDPSHIKALDDRRVAITMDAPNLLLMKNNTMHNTSALDIKDVKAHATSTDQWATDYFKKNLAPGNGPFMLDEYVPGDRIVLKANPGYYGTKPKLAKVIQKIVPDAAERELLIKSGEVDMIMVPPVQDLNTLKQDSSLQVLTFPNPRNLFLEMNNKMSPFDKKAARQAVSYAVPYDNILKDVFHGYAQANRSIIGNGMPSSDFSTWNYNTDLKKAADMLASAGFAGGQGAPPITLTVRADWQEAERAAVLIQSNLKQIGLNVSIQKVAFAPFNEQEQGRKLHMWIDEWLSWVNDPWYHMSWNVSSTSPTNYVSYSNPAVDALVKQWTLSLDKAGRIQGSKDAQKLVIGDAPHAFLVGPNWNVVLRSNVKGYVYYNDELNRYAYMYKV